MNWYVGSGYFPLITNSSCNAPWAGQDKKLETCGFNNPRNNTYYDIVINGLGSYSGSTQYSSVFDFLVVTNSAEFNSIVPNPGNNGVITSTLQASQYKGQPSTLLMTWTGTGGVNDSYSVWIYTSGNPSVSSGYTFSTGCGAKYFMTLRSDVVVVPNGDGTFSATVTNLNSVSVTAVTVVVDRIGGYTNSYKSILVNGSTTFGVSLVLYIILILLMKL